MARKNSPGEATAREIARSMVESRSMDDLASYLNRGRQFVDHSNEDLQRLWPEAFRVMVRTFDGKTFSAQANLLQDDLRAEHRLRGLEPDEDAVKPEVKNFREIVQREYEKPGSDDGPSHAIKQYLEQSRKKSN